MRAQPISKSVRWATGRADSLDHISSHFAPELDKLNFKLVDQTPDRVVFRDRYLPSLGIFLGLITFPVGILFWVFWRKEDIVTFTLTDDAGVTRVLIAGQCGKPVARYLAAIPDAAPAALVPVV